MAQEQTYGIKIITRDHLRPEFPHLTADFDGKDGRQTLMNVASEGPGLSQAANLSDGHLALVYVAGEQRFIWTIRFVGPIDRENRLGAAHGIPKGHHGKWAFWRPIRIVARVNVSFGDLSRAPTREWINRQTGWDWRPCRGGYFKLDRERFMKIYRAISWDKISESI